MEHATLPRAVAQSVTSQFFGDSEGIGVSGPPLVPSELPPRLASANAESSLPPPASMSNRPGWVAPVLVAAAALVAGVVLTLLFI
jgi:hypothetical protein